MNIQTRARTGKTLPLLLLLLLLLQSKPPCLPKTKKQALDDVKWFRSTGTRLDLTYLPMKDRQTLMNAVRGNLGFRMKVWTTSFEEESLWNAGCFSAWVGGRGCRELWSRDISVFWFWELNWRGDQRPDLGTGFWRILWGPSERRCNFDVEKLDGH